MNWIQRYRARLRRDDATAEVIAYVFMFAIGSMALIFSMEILTDAQERGSDLAAAQQADQVGQLTASLVEQAARVGQSAPNATYATAFQLPDVVGPHNMTIRLDRTLRTGGSAGDCDFKATVHVHSGDEQIATSVTLGNVSTIEINGQCLRLQGSVDSSAQSATVRYMDSASSGSGPTIAILPGEDVR